MGRIGQIPCKNPEVNIIEKIDMEKEFKIFFSKKRFWHSISKQLRSTNLITTYKQ